MARPLLLAATFPLLLTPALAALPAPAAPAPLAFCLGWIDTEGHVLGQTSLDLAQDGTLTVAYVDAADGVSLATLAPGGAAWRVREVTPAVTTFGVDLARGADGTLHLAFAVGGAVEYVRVAGDEVLRETAAGLDAHEARIALDGAGAPHVFYVDGVDDALHEAVRGGAGWNHRVVDDGPAFEVDAATDGGGTIHVAYLDRPDGEVHLVYERLGADPVREEVDSHAWMMNVRVAVSPGGDAHASATTVDDFFGFLPNYYARHDGRWAGEALLLEPLLVPQPLTTALAVASDGTPRLAYSNGDTLRYGAKAAGAWVFDTVEDNPPINIGPYDLVLRDDLPLLAYPERANNWLRVAQGHPPVAGDECLHVPLAECVAEDPAPPVFAPSLWTEGKGATGKNAHGQPLMSVDVAVDSAGRTHLAYSEFDNAEVTYAPPVGPPERVASAQVLGRIALALDGTGRAHAAWKDFAAPSRGVHYAVHLAPGVWTDEVVDARTFDGLSVALALDAQGAPHLAYDAGWSLRFATRTSDGWATRTLEEGRGTGLDASLAVDASGRIHAAYYDAFRAKLRYARADPAGFSFETVDKGIWSGLSTALAVDAEGSVHLGFLSGRSLRPAYAHRDASGWTLVKLQPPCAAYVYLGAALTLAADRPVWAGVAWDWAAGVVELHAFAAAGEGFDLQLVRAADNFEAAVAADAAGGALHVAAIRHETDPADPFGFPRFHVVDATPLRLGAPTTLP